MTVNFNNHYGFCNPYNQRNGNGVAFKNNIIKKLAQDLVKNPNSTDLRETLALYSEKQVASVYTEIRKIDKTGNTIKILKGE